MKRAVNDDLSVMALVVTYNAPDALIGCVRALAQQTRRPDEVLVIDNASTVPAIEALEREGLLDGVTVIRSDSNGGPAGGFARACTEFLASSHDAAWVMDDDVFPEPDCLSILAGHPRPLYIFPRVMHGPDRVVREEPSWAWAGQLIDRTIIEQVGVPEERLVWWAEDTEYIKWRIPVAGFPEVLDTRARVSTSHLRTGTRPQCTVYYEIRNTLWLHFHTDYPVRWLPRKMAKTLARTLLRPKGPRGRELGLLARGTWDGLRGRLGETIPLQSSPQT